MRLSASQGIGYLDHSVPFRFEWVLAYQAQRHPLVSNQETFSCEWHEPRSNCKEVWAQRTKSMKKTGFRIMWIQEPGSGPFSPTFLPSEVVKQVLSAPDSNNTMVLFIERRTSLFHGPAVMSPCTDLVQCHREGDQSHSICEVTEEKGCSPRGKSRHHQQKRNEY